jgi:hypothetical protein
MHADQILDRVEDDVVGVVWIEGAPMLCAIRAFPYQFSLPSFTTGLSIKASLAKPGLDMLVM